MQEAHGFTFTKFHLDVFDWAHGRCCALVGRWHGHCGKILPWPIGEIGIDVVGARGLFVTVEGFQILRVIVCHIIGVGVLAHHEIRDADCMEGCGLRSISCRFSLGCLGGHNLIEVILPYHAVSVGLFEQIVVERLLK